MRWFGVGCDGWTVLTSLSLAACHHGGGEAGGEPREASATTARSGSTESTTRGTGSGGGGGSSSTTTLGPITFLPPSDEEFEAPSAVTEAELFAEQSEEARAQWEQCDAAAEQRCAVAVFDPEFSFPPDCVLSLARADKVFIECEEVPYVEPIGAGGAPEEWINHWGWDGVFRLKGETCEQALAAEFVAVVYCDQVN